MNQITGIFKDRSEIWARILFFRLKDTIPLKLRSSSLMCGTTYNQLSSWTKEKKNLPKNKNKNTLKAYICEGI